MRIQNRIVLSFAIALTITAAASAQRRAVPTNPAEARVAITLQVAGQTYHFEGKAACQRAPIASIYSVLAEMWSVQQSDGQRSVMLTLWRPRSTSGDVFSLNIDIGGKGYVVNTVKFGGGSAVRGSGKVAFTTSGAGGTFTINATTADGAAITGTIKCGAFTPATAEGG